MPRPRSLPDEVLLDLVPEHWVTTPEMSVIVGLKGFQIGNYQLGAALRRLVLLNTVEHNGFPGTRKLQWRRAKVENQLGRVDPARVTDPLLAALTTGQLLDELKERGYREGGPDGRALSDATRQLRATLPLAMIESGRPVLPGYPGQDPGDHR